MPTKDIIVATEIACKNLPPTEAAKLRTEVASTIKSAKIPSSNLSRNELKALKKLKKEDSIVILPADKGRATVVMDKEKYEDQVK